MDETEAQAPGVALPELAAVASAKGTAAAAADHTAAAAPAPVPTDTPTGATSAASGAAAARAAAARALRVRHAAPPLLVARLRLSVRWRKQLDGLLDSEGHASGTGWHASISTIPRRRRAASPATCRLKVADWPADARRMASSLYMMDGTSAASHCPCASGPSSTDRDSAAGHGRRAAAGEAAGGLGPQHDFGRPARRSVGHRPSARLAWWGGGACDWPAAAAPPFTAPSSTAAVAPFAAPPSGAARPWAACRACRAASAPAACHMAPGRCGRRGASAGRPARPVACRQPRKSVPEMTGPAGTGRPSPLCTLPGLVAAAGSFSCRSGWARAGSWQPSTESISGPTCRSDGSRMGSRPSSRMSSGRPAPVHAERVKTGVEGPEQPPGLVAPEARPVGLRLAWPSPLPSEHPASPASAPPAGVCDGSPARAAAGSRFAAGGWSHVVSAALRPVHDVATEGPAGWRRARFRHWLRHGFRHWCQARRTSGPDHPAAARPPSSRTQPARRRACTDRPGAPAAHARAGRAKAVAARTRAAVVVVSDERGSGEAVFSEQADQAVLGLAKCGLIDQVGLAHQPHHRQPKRRRQRRVQAGGRSDAHVSTHAKHRRARGVGSQAGQGGLEVAVVPAEVEQGEKPRGGLAELGRGPGELVGPIE
eukprot:scaffold30241_cov89-Isochrysis_galbana.AAC.3